MLVEGDVVVAEHPLDRNGLLYLGDSRDGVEVSSDEGAPLFLLGGEPFEDEIDVVELLAGRTHDEIVAAREEGRRSRRPLLSRHGSASSAVTTFESPLRRCPTCS